MRRVGLLSGVAFLALQVAPGGAWANDQLLEMQKDPAQWVMQLGNYAGHRYSELSQINRDNVGDLGVSWTFSTGVLRGHEGGPLVIGDVMYIHSPFPNIVYALDLNEPGRKIWDYVPTQDPSVIPVMCCDTVNRGVAYMPAEGGEPAKIFISLADTTLVALNAETGEELWRAVNGDPTKGETSTAAPLVVKDKVLVGISGGEFGVRGHLTAYDAKTGEQAWRAYSTGPDSEVLIDPATTTELGSEEGRFLAPCPGPDLEDRVLVVQGIARGQPPPQKLLALLELDLQLGDLGPRQLAQVHVLALPQDLAVLLQAAARLLPGFSGRDQRVQSRVLLAKLAQPCGVADHHRVGERRLQLGVPRE